MLALLNQFSFTQVAVGGLVIVGLNTVLLRWAMSRLQADPRNDADPADRDAEILGDERARTSVATPRPRRLQPSAAGTGKSLAEAGLGEAETVVPAEMASAAAPALPGGAFAKAQLNPPGKATPSVGPRPGAAAKQPAAKPEPVAAKAGSSSVAEASGMPVLGKADLISVDKPGPSLPTVSSGQIAPVSLAKPAEAPVAAKPEFGLIEPAAAKSEEPDDVKKTKTIKASAVSSGLTLIPPPAPAESKPEAAKPPPAVEAKKTPVVEAKKAAPAPVPAPAPAPVVEAKKVEPLPAAAPKETPAAPKDALVAIAPAAPAPVAEVPAPAPAAVKTEPAPVAPPAPEPEAPAKSFWRPRIFLPTKVAPSKPAEPVEAKAVVEPPAPAPVEAAPVAPVAAAEKLAEAGAAAAGALIAAKVAVDAEAAKPAAAKVEPAAAKVEPAVVEKPVIPAEPAPAAAEKLPVVAAKPVAVEKPAPEPAPIVPILPAAPPVPEAKPVHVPSAALIPAASREVSSTTTKPVMSTETTANRASAQLTLSFEITSLQLTPFFKLGGVQIRPLSNVVSLHLISAQASDSPMAAGISFEIDKVELDDQSNLRSLLLKPLGQAQAASTPQSKLQVDAVQITQGGEGSIQVTSAQSASTAVQLISLLTIASMEFTPSFEIGSLRLEPNSKSVQLRLAPSQRAGALDLPPSFDITGIQLGNESQFSLLSLTPSAK